ncbi:lycopene cyclase domain-containing protein [Angustibacter luteus]|uniref:Lycopene cyclase domain-containing protein n=1 Tax=Angustibacter luteus TaxID=658456 RepID=A0ABW1JBM6_9ACTN
MTYTQLCLVAVPLAVLLDLALLRTRLLARKAFWVSYAIIVFFQLLTNGWLTGRGVVTYSGSAILGTGEAVAFGHWRVLYAPVEDLAFGFSLVLQTLSWWVFWGRRGVQRDRVRSGRREVPTAVVAPGADGSDQLG